MLLAFATSLLGCGSADYVSYEKSVQPIFDVNCTSANCHNQKGKAGGLILRSRNAVIPLGKTQADLGGLGMEVSIILNNYVINVPATQTAGLRVNKSNPSASVLLNRIKWQNAPPGYSPVGWRMPPNNQLPPEQIALIEHWITEVVPNY